MSIAWQHPLDFCDVRALLALFKKLPVFRTTPVSLRSVKLDLGRGQGRWCSGRAFTRERRLRLVVGRYANGAQLAEVLLHELVHLALPSGVAHGERFRLTMARAVREAWGIVVDTAPALAGRWKVRAYVMDDQIRAALLPLLASGAFEIPMLAPRPGRVALGLRVRFEILVEKRAAHAVVMLATAEKRLKRARTIERKWKLKVRYYEQRAAASRSSKEAR